MEFIINFRGRSGDPPAPKIKSEEAPSSRNPTILSWINKLAKAPFYLFYIVMFTSGKYLLCLLIRLGAPGSHVLSLSAPSMVDVRILRLLRREMLAAERQQGQPH